MKLLYVLRKDLLESRKGMMIYALTLFLVMFLPSFLTMVFSRPSYPDISAFSQRHVIGSTALYYRQFFINTLFIGGFIITSMAFREDMYGKATQHNWLMLPASPLEKLSVKIITTALIYPVVLLLFISVSSLVIEGINTLIFGNRYPLFNPLQGDYWKLIAIYIVTQSIFLLGSSYFRKVSFIKTALMLSLVSNVIGIIAILLARVIFRDYFDGMSINESAVINNFGISFGSQEMLTGFRVFEVIGKILFWVVLAPFCWTVSYFRVREVEADDAV